MKVKLLYTTNSKPEESASHAALTCYAAEVPEMGKMIDVEKRLFNVSHHTTLQHFSFTFQIEDIAVSDITLGLHLTHPFYNSDQRSGRYCAKMFVEPNFEAISDYIKTHWPQVGEKERAEAVAFVKFGTGIYHKNISAATDIAKIFLKEERRFIQEKAVEMNGPKIAQEQLRVFISTIFPTAIDYTVNLTALAAMHESAWTPAMKYVTSEMVKQVCEKFPEISYMFKPERRRTDEWSPELLSTNTEIKYKPELKMFPLSDRTVNSFIKAVDSLKHPLDKLHFSPELMDNSHFGIETEVEISVATMGQDQRHRTIRRSTPMFTGNFYLPPIIRELRLEKEATELMSKWLELKKTIPASLFAALAPYGAMVKYEKNSPFNALIHEQAKRLCWCAQEEIYHLSRLLRLALSAQGHDSLLSITEPPCYQKGLCGEGDRYCGRDIKLRETGDFFPERKI